MFAKAREDVMMANEKDVMNTVKMEERVEEENDDLIGKDGSSDLIVFKS